MFRQLLLGSPENVTRFFNKVVSRPQPVQRLRSPCRSRHLNHPESHGEQTGGHAGIDSPCCLGNDPSEQLDAGSAGAAGAAAGGVCQRNHGPLDLAAAKLSADWDDNDGTHGDKSKAQQLRKPNQKKTTAELRKQQLHHQHIAETINHQARQQVALAMNQAIKRLIKQALAQR